MADKKKGGSAGQDFLNWCRSGLVHFLDRLYSKDDRIIIFGSSNGRQFYGCPKQIYEYMVKDCSKEFDLYYYLDRPSSDDPRCLPKGGAFNWRTIKMFLKAGTVVGSHGIFDFGPWGLTSKKRTFINTWHGFPLKAIGHSSKYQTKWSLKDTEKMVGLMTALLASSEFESELFQRCFKLDKSRIWVVGQPRNDRLADDVLDAAPPIVQKFPTHRKIILYCPTWRDAEKVRLFPFDGFDLARLERFLEEENAIILMRHHINEPGDKEMLKGGRIIDFSFSVFPDINEFLPFVDVLVTDYSSIYLDFLLVDRPIVFLPYDLEHYTKSRGFMIEDYDKWTPGPKVRTFEEFLDTTRDLLNGNDKHEEDRKRVNAVVNSAQTAQTPKKVVELLRAHLKKRKEGAP